MHTKSFQAKYNSTPDILIFKKLPFISSIKGLYHRHNIPS